MTAAPTTSSKPKVKKARTPIDVIVVDTRDAMRSSKAEARSSKTVGFGCPPLTEWPHHIMVVIPAGRGGDIRVLENHGILGDAEYVERCVVPRARWNEMADTAKAELNVRLREKGLATSRWQPGENRVDRILGAELLTLAWATVAADDADVAAVVSAWVSLQPSERLWLAGRVLTNPGSVNVRRGIALLLSCGPIATDTRPRPRGTCPLAAKGTSGLPLFELG